MLPWGGTAPAPRTCRKQLKLHFCEMQNRVRGSISPFLWINTYMYLIVEGFLSMAGG